MNSFSSDRIKHTSLILVNLNRKVEIMPNTLAKESFHFNEPLTALSKLKLEFLLKETDRLTNEMQNRPLDEELVQRSHLFLTEYKRRLKVNSSSLTVASRKINL